MACGRIQCWALLLSPHKYIVWYNKGKTNTNADALRVLPLPSEVAETQIPAEVIHLMEHLDSTPLDFSQICRWKYQDLTPSKVRHYVLEGCQINQTAMKICHRMCNRGWNWWGLSVCEGVWLWLRRGEGSEHWRCSIRLTLAWLG